MAAGLGFKTFTSGEVLTAADTNGYLMQGVMVFANASARSAAITAPTEGQYSYLKDTNSTEYYDGAAWVAGVEGDISGVTAGVGISGGGTAGTVTVTNSMATAITTKGDLIPGTGSGTFARLAAGNNGESLVSDSSTATGLRYNASGNANLIAGGSFDIWQRGTGAFTTNAVYTSDRFYVYSSSSFSLSQETSVVPTGATNSAKITATAGSSYANMQFALEQSEVEKLAGQTVTFSVYLRANATYNGTTALKINTSTTGNSQTPTWTTQATSTAAAPIP
jgi:hypothetical protein